MKFTTFLKTTAAVALTLVAPAAFAGDFATADAELIHVGSTDTNIVSVDLAWKKGVLFGAHRTSN